jgi:hypothetical protein
MAITLTLLLYYTKCSPFTFYDLIYYYATEYFLNDLKCKKMGRTFELNIPYFWLQFSQTTVFKQLWSLWCIWAEKCLKVSLWDECGMCLCVSVLGRVSDQPAVHLCFSFKSVAWYWQSIVSMFCHRKHPSLTMFPVVLCYRNLVPLMMVWTPCPT